MAAYRFLGNEEVEWTDMMQPHWARTAARMQQHAVVLCIADTTELDFNGQDMEGSGPLSFEAQRGMYLHPTYAVTPDREPLGLLDAWMWAREPLDENGHRGSIKENTRWIESYERVAEQAAVLPETRLVYVTDREGDIAALMEQADALGYPADWLIRAQHNRNLAEGGKLWDKVEASAVLGEIAFILPGRAGQKAREVRQELRASRLKLPGKRQLEVTCVVAREIGAPAGLKPVVWRLVTNTLSSRTIAPSNGSPGQCSLQIIPFCASRSGRHRAHAHNLQRPIQYGGLRWHVVCPPILYAGRTSSPKVMGT